MVLLAFATSTAPADKFIVDINGGADYTSIRDAIRAADDGDTIEVNSGTYHECFTVDKALFLTGKDTGSGRPVIDSEGIRSDTVILENDGIVLDGFDLNGSYNNEDTRFAGIKVLSNDNTIINSSVSDHCKGIEFHRGNNNIIRGNDISDNYYGIMISRSDNNTISYNAIHGNFDGVFITSSSSNKITINDINHNQRTGLILKNSPHNYIEDNTISYSHLCISVDEYSCDNKTIIDEYRSSNRFENYIEDLKTGSGISYTSFEDE